MINLLKLMMTCKNPKSKSILNNYLINLMILKNYIHKTYTSYQKKMKYQNLINLLKLYQYNKKTFDKLKIFCYSNIFNFISISPWSFINSNFITNFIINMTFINNIIFYFFLITINFRRSKFIISDYWYWSSSTSCINF